MWAKAGATDENSLAFKLHMQKDILVQCVANMGLLCMPMMIQAYGYKNGGLTSLELIGWVSLVHPNQEFLDPSILDLDHRPNDQVEKLNELQKQTE